MFILGVAKAACNNPLATKRTLSFRLGLSYLALSDFLLVLDRNRSNALDGCTN